ncbi:hypothetical protein BZG36_01820 [Bifiguratus adelaidae]|uniref:Uncharacterized protein n=1 Tax=Bifiguratus adelaidae TaxID=1938954 RepID=A0A261Y2B6_9FUNG|nr:hypothetical protein BZG36_01820 [Bifiguratus adelaidae]
MDSLTGKRPPTSTTVLIIGGGASGICSAYHLKYYGGIHDFVAVEKSNRLGGTWNENTYPGAACDINSRLYSFSFAINTKWSEFYSGQKEIQDWEVQLMEWNDQRNLWQVTLKRSNGDDTTKLEAKFVISGVGQLSHPRWANIPGRETFEGITFHSAQWDHSQPLERKRIAVIGNGASAVQFIPTLGRKASELTVFQQSANWLLPRGNFKTSQFAKAVLEYIPFAAKLQRIYQYVKRDIRFTAIVGAGSSMNRLASKMSLKYLDSKVKDPELKRKLTPDYPFGCKRVLIVDGYLETLLEPHVYVEDEVIAKIVPDGLITSSGKKYTVDILIFATGFRTTEFLFPMKIRGKRGMPLKKTWQEGAHAYLGMTLHNFPNFCMLYGPNTNLSHKCQSKYITKLIKTSLKSPIPYFDVRSYVQDQFNAKLQQDLERTTWKSPQCSSWYKQNNGKITANWSTFTTVYWWETLWPVLSEYKTTPEQDVVY